MLITTTNDIKLKCADNLRLVIQNYDIKEYEDEYYLSINTNIFNIQNNNKLDFPIYIYNNNAFVIIPRLFENAN